MAKDGSTNGVIDFDSRYDNSERVGKTFKLGGREWHTRAYAPPRAFRNGERGIDASIGFFLGILIAEEREDFLAMVEDEEAPFSAYQLDQFASAMIGELSERPTASPVSSGAGETPTGTQ